MKKWTLFILLLVLQTAVHAQEAVIHKNEKGVYLLHTVAPKENFYALGRMYNIPAKDIASFNKLDMNNGLAIGQQIMIPLTAANYAASGSEGAPIYYVVGEGEGLFRISSKNGGVSMANLRKWNNLANDNLNTGQRLVVGYVKGGAARPEPGTAAVPVKKEEPVIPAVTPAAKEPEPQKPANTTAPPEVTRTTINENPPASRAQQPASVTSGGYFREQFEAQSRTAGRNKEQTSSAGIFKTASGWQDGKYYALMDGVEPGTILKVINPSNNKVVYAKVLGGMSGIRQNAGLDVRISNAAASILNINDTDKFVVKVNY